MMLTTASLPSRCFFLGTRYSIQNLDKLGDDFVAFERGEQSVVKRRKGYKGYVIGHGHMTLVMADSLRSSPLKSTTALA